MSKTKNISGQRFGRLIAKSLDYQIKSKRHTKTYWLCVCDCGKEKSILMASLTSGNTKSCGCMKVDRFKLPDGEANFRQVFRQYIGNARARKLDFVLSESRFRELTSQNCYYCGQQPSTVMKKEKYGYFVYNGIDRIDSSKGYTAENTVPCCKTCNQAKMDASMEEFKEWIFRVSSNMFNKELFS